MLLRVLPWITFGYIKYKLLLNKIFLKYFLKKKDTPLDTQFLD